MHEKRVLDYVKPEVRDHGELKDLTAASKTGSNIDVPSGTPSNQLTFISGS